MENDTYQSVLDDFIDMLTQAGIDTIEGGAGGVARVAEYAARRTAHMAPLVGEDGFLAALAAETDNVALRAGLAAVEEADAADARLRGMLEGAMRLGARLLNLAAGDLRG